MSFFSSISAGMPYCAARSFIATVGDEVGDQVGATLGHQLGARLVDQVAMLDGPHTMRHRALDRLGGIGVGEDVAAEGLGLLHSGLDLGNRELQAVERVERRGDAAGNHDLHMVAALAHLLAHDLAHLIDTVDVLPQEGLAIAAGAGVARVGARAAVGMSAGRPERASGNEQARAADQPLLDRRLHAPIGAAGVAHGGEAAVEHLADALGGARRRQCQRYLLHAAHVDFAVHAMHVAIDQAGHQHAAATVDHLRRVGADRPIGDLLDFFALD